MRNALGGMMPLNNFCIDPVVYRKVGKVVIAGGLTVAQFSVLEVLYHQGDMRIGELIEAALTTGGNMTVIIKNLEASRLIEKYSDENDKRMTIVRITEKGVLKIKEVFHPHMLALNDYFSVFSAEEKKKLTLLLNKLKRE